MLGDFRKYSSQQHILASFDHRVKAHCRPRRPHFVSLPQSQDHGDVQILNHFYDAGGRY